jgi:hypothetical protein
VEPSRRDIKELVLAVHRLGLTLAETNDSIKALAARLEKKEDK